MRRKVLAGLVAVVLVTAVAGWRVGHIEGARPTATTPAVAVVAVDTSAPAGPTARAVGAVAMPPTMTPPAGLAEPASAPTWAASQTPISAASMDYGPQTARTIVPPVTNIRPLPACSYGELATPLSGPGDWVTTLVDTAYALPGTYEPADLVNPIGAGISSGYNVRALMIPDLTAMNAAAGEAGVPLGFASGYRSYWTQVATFNYWVYNHGYDQALLESARPGHSEHQLGLAIDFMDLYGEAPWIYRDFARDSKAGVWLAANAWRYGFVMSYPAGMEDVTCYEYEPWHYRYVGPAAAASIHRSGLTLREWIWRRQPTPPPVATPRWP